MRTVKDIGWFGDASQYVVRLRWVDGYGLSALLAGCRLSALLACVGLSDLLVGLGI